MKKIMFNDKYSLTKAVLENRKTQTRRILHCPKNFGSKYVSGFRVCTNSEGLQFVYLVDEEECEIEGSVNAFSSYRVGEEVAVAQSYSQMKVRETLSVQEKLNESFLLDKFEQSKGWGNKMFVKAKYMPHRIKITNIRVEHLQDISDEDCLKEGIEGYTAYSPSEYEYSYHGADNMFSSQREAFVSLIDKTCGKGTWESNPWVFVYDFELIK